MGKKKNVIKIGDRVNITDGSWVFGVNNNEFSRNCSTFNDDRKDLLVISADCDLLCKERNYKVHILDLLVYSEDRNQYWFVMSDQCKIISPRRTINIDGKELNISEESFREFKRQFSD